VTTLTCLSVPGCRVPLSVLESLSFAPDDVPDALLDLRRRTGAGQLCLLATCERTELYACWQGPSDPAALVRALAANRNLAVDVVGEATTRLAGRAAARHLLRVTAGLESFVLGERDIGGPGRSAALASRAAGTGGVELDRLLGTAVHTSRRVHRHTGFGEGGRSVAAAAVHQSAAEHGGDLAGRRVVVVGAGQVATEVVSVATRLGAAVTVCNRTRRHAERLAAAGATVVDLTRLFDVLATADVAIFGTAAPHRLLAVDRLARVHPRGGRDLLVIDLCVPRNVDPDVRALPGVRLVDLADLRATGAGGNETVTRDVDRAEQIVEEELDRYQRWLTGRTAAMSLRRLRGDLDDCSRSHLERTLRGIPQEFHPLVEEAIRRVVGQVAHGPTQRLLEAAEAGEDELVEVLAGLFAGSR
jgi:glutamyl-tRNA reductase